MEPGKRMSITVDLVERDSEGEKAVFKGKGEMDGQSTVSAKVTLGCSNLADRNPALKSVDEKIIQQLRSHCAVLRGYVPTA
jgi:hypothetical protein